MPLQKKNNEFKNRFYELNVGWNFFGTSVTTKIISDSMNKLNNYPVWWKLQNELEDVPNDLIWEFLWYQIIWDVGIWSLWFYYDWKMLMLNSYYLL